VVTSPRPDAQSPPKVDGRYLATSSLRRLVDQHLQELVITVVVFALVLFFTVDSPYFFTTSNAAARGQLHRTHRLLRARRGPDPDPGRDRSVGG